MYFENSPVALVIEKTDYESNDSHYGVDKKRRISSKLIQKIISIIFGIMSLGYGIVNIGNDTQLEIINHVVQYSNAKSNYVKFTYTNISGKCFSATFTFTSITYLQESNEATEAPTRSTSINKKFQLSELHLQIHVERGTYTDTLACLLQIIIERLLHLIIIFAINKVIFRKLLKKRDLKSYSYLSNSPPPSPSHRFPPYGSQLSSV